MKHLYFSLLLAGLTAVPAMGQETIYQFPKTLAPEFKTSTKAPQLRVPTAIDDKSKGITMYAGQRLDESKHRSWVKWNLANASKFTRLKEYIYHSDYNFDQNKGIIFGAYSPTDDAYYAFFNMHFTYGDMPTALAKVDIATGDTTNVFNFADLKATDEEQNKWYDGYYKYAMAFDPVNEVMYALGANYKQVEINGETVTAGYTEIWEVNPQATTLNELFTKVRDLDGLYWDFCFDAKGNAWFAQKYAAADGITVQGTKLVKMDGDFNVVGTPVTMKSEWGEEINSVYFSTMSFDYSTGDLYYIPCGESGSTTVYKVNPETGLIQSQAWFMTGNHFTGLYIPFLAGDDAEAPARVSNLDATPDANGGSTVSLSCTTPSKNIVGDDLSDLKSVAIYRKNAGYATTELTDQDDLLENSQLVKELPVTEFNAQVSAALDSQPAGVNTYYVLATNSKGNGTLDSIRCCVGEDVPGAVNDIQLKKNGTGVDVSWTAPENGANNGYIDPSDLTYTLTRFPDSVVVAENLAATSFTDNTLGEQQPYSYRIQAANAKGKGATTESGTIMAGSALKTPISLTFETRSDADRWYADPYNSLYWYYAGWDGCDDDYKCFVAYGDYYNDINGTLVSPPLYLEEGKTYRFTTDFRADFYDDAYFDLYTAVGTNSESQEGATIIGNHEGEQYAEMYHREKYEDYFTAPSTGTYYYSVKAHANAKYNIFHFYGLNVDYVAENDMSAVAVNDALEAVQNTTNTCTVRVRNNGSKDQSDYTVKLLMDNEGKLIEVGTGKAEAGKVLKAGEYADVKVSYNPPYDGQWDFYGVVQAQGDEDHANDTTAVKTINVLEEGSQAWTNVISSGFSEGTGTDAPFKNYSDNEYSQSLYLASEINAPEIAMIRRIGWMYDGNDLSDRTNPVDVKIYLAHTDLSSFTSTERIAEDDRELVAEGQIVFEPGQNHIVSFNLDHEFEYNGEQNLAVICEKSGTAGVQFCALWHCFDNNWNLNTRRTLLESGGSTLYPSAPVLYLGIFDATGVERVQLLGTEVAYADGLLAFDKVVDAEVFTLGGNLVKSFKGSSARLNLAKGVYVVRAKDADGKVITKKINVK